MRKHGGVAVALDRSATSKSVSQQNSRKPTPTPPLAADTDELALGYCYHYHVVRRGAATVTDDMVLASMRALGMASVSNGAHSTRLQEKAFSYYLSALRMVNAALRSPVGMMQNTTLLAIINLSCFESIQGGKRKRSLRDWAVHTQGMAALIEQRGPQQLRSVAGRSYFFQTCTFVLSNCIRAGLRIPDAMSNLLTKLLSPVNPRSLIMLTMLASVNLKADILHGTLTVPGDIVPRALQLDAQFASALSFDIPTPQGFDFKAITHWRRAGSTLPSYALLYESEIAGNMWNTVRTGRMLCNGIIVETLANFAGSNCTIETSRTIAKSREIIYRMQSEMLASLAQDERTTGVPFGTMANMLSGDAIFPKDFSGSPIEFGELVPDDLPLLCTPRVYAQCFNLAFAGRLADYDSEIRQVSRHALTVIGEIRGLPLASILAASLKDNQIAAALIRYHDKADLVPSNDSYVSTHSAPMHVKTE